MGTRARLSGRPYVDQRYLAVWELRQHGLDVVEAFHADALQRVPENHLDSPLPASCDLQTLGQANLVVQALLAQPFVERLVVLT